MEQHVQAKEVDFYLPVSEVQLSDQSLVVSSIHRIVSQKSAFTGITDHESCEATWW